MIIIYWYLIFLVILFCILIPRDNKYVIDLIRRKKKGNRKMPKDLMKDFIGKVCLITMYNEIGAYQGTVLAVEENWIKFEEKKGKVRLINGDMIRDITLADEKHQK